MLVGDDGCGVIPERSFARPASNSWRERKMGQNERVLRDLYVQYANGELESVMAAIAEDVVWRSSGTPNRMRSGGDWYGRDGARCYFAALALDWTLQAFDVQEVITRDDRRFAVRIRLDAESNVTGKLVRFERVDLLTMENGEIKTCTELFDSAPLERASRL